MSKKNDDTWYPLQKHLDHAHVLKLAKTLGVDNYDDLQKLSLSDPAKYWTAVCDYVGYVWSKQPESYMELPCGKEFPVWFPGGELNWVDSVLRWGSDPLSVNQIAVLAEHETGGTRSMSYAELAQLIRRFAAGLEGMGLGRGDSVGLLCEPGLETTVSVLALSYLGCIVIPLFSGFGGDAITSRLEPSGATVLIATTGFTRRGRLIDVIGTVREVQERLPEVATIIWKTSDGIAAPEGEKTWASLAAGPEIAQPAARMSPNDPFMIIYTSGTTGKPKGIVHVHGGFPLKIAQDSAVHWDIGQGDVFFWPVDMGWVAGPITVCATLLRGATLICYDGTPDFPDWSRMSRIIERHKVTHFGASPTLVRGMKANEEIALQGNRSSVRLLVTAGEGIDVEHFNWFRKNFAQADSPLMNSSGGTEVSGVLLCSVPVKPIRPGAFNTASPGMDVVVIEPSGTPVIGQVAELSVREPFVGMTKSFWHDDERYLETYWQAVKGVWVHGDLAIEEEDGSFFILGRSDDTLKIAGKRVGPAEIEQLILELDGVQEAAAIGVEDSQKGERVVVFLVLARGKALEPATLMKSISARIDAGLGKPFRPSEVFIVDQLPKTRSSKIMRRVIKKICANQSPGDLSSLVNPEVIDELRAVIGQK